MASTFLSMIDTLFAIPNFALALVIQHVSTSKYFHKAGEAEEWSIE